MPKTPLLFPAEFEAWHLFEDYGGFERDDYLLNRDTTHHA